MVVVVAQGMLMVSPKHCSSKEALVRLWLHESMRVFHDRLIDDQDKSHFRNILMELVGKNLGSAVGSPQDLFPQSGSIIFGDFLKPGLDPQDRPYEEVGAHGQQCSTCRGNCCITVYAYADHAGMASTPVVLLSWCLPEP